MSVYRRTRTQKLPDGTSVTVQNKNYTIAVQFQGKQHCRLTPATTKEEAQRLERALAAEVRRGHWQILQDLRSRRAPTDLTLGALIALYRQHAPSCREIGPKTIELNIHALANILRTARPASFPSFPSVETALLSLLTSGLVSDFKSAILARCADLDPETAQAKYRSANSLLLQARSLFTPDLQHAYTSSGHTLPAALAGFLSAPKFARVQKTEYHPAPDALIAKTFAALPDLERADPSAFVSIWLALGFGLRKSEIAECRPDWFRDTDGQPAIALEKICKNNRFGDHLRCQLDAWPRLQPHVAAATAAGREHLLPGTATERTEDTFRRTNAWLRALGWSTQKAIHELRAWAGCQVANAHGLLAARDFLRHAQYATTEKYYGRYIRAKITPVPLQIPTLAPPQIAREKSA